MLSLILDLLAPKAKAELTLNPQSGYKPLIESLKKQHKIKSDTGLKAKFRVKGNFFSDFRAAKSIVGERPSPKHYAKVGFNLEVCSNDDGRVLLKAEERVILGYLELQVVGEALLFMLEDLASSTGAHSSQSS